MVEHTETTEKRNLIFNVSTPFPQQMQKALGAGKFHVIFSSAGRKADIVFYGGGGSQAFPKVIAVRREEDDYPNCLHVELTSSGDLQYLKDIEDLFFTTLRMPGRIIFG